MGVMALGLEADMKVLARRIEDAQARLREVAPRSELLRLVDVRRNGIVTDEKFLDRWGCNYYEAMGNYIDAMDAVVGAKSN
jgi:hypothetical protein